MAISCGELMSMNEFQVNFNCCLLYMQSRLGFPYLRISGSYDGGENETLEHGNGRGRELYSCVSTVRIMNSTRIWCNITHHSNSASPSTITTCKHHVFTNNCQDQGNMFIQSGYCSKL